MPARPEASTIRTPPIGSVDNALRLLLLLRDHPLVRVSDASTELGVGVSTAHRLMSALVFRGFVEQDPATRAYRAGPALADIGLAVVREMDVRGHMHPHMERLCAEIGETIQLMVLQGADIQFIDAVETSKALRTSSRLGHTMLAHCTSGGKALLAEVSSERLHALYPSQRLPTLTPRSIATRTALEAELGQIRDRGYAVADGEGEPDVAAVGVVVRDAFGKARVGLAASGPRSRVNTETIPTIAAAMRRAAREAATGLA